MKIRISFIVTSLLFIASLAQANQLCFLGDSQSAASGGLFNSIEHRIPQGNQWVSGMAVCGAHIASYLDRPSVGCSYANATFMQISNGRGNVLPGRGQTDAVDSVCRDADTVVVQAGDNDWPSMGLAVQNARAMATRLRALGKKCIWIGPASIGGPRCTNVRGHKGQVSAAIRATVEPLGCQFVDSFGLTDGKMQDSGDPYCTHYLRNSAGNASYNLWANAIQGRLQEVLASPEE